MPSPTRCSEPRGWDPSANSSRTRIPQWKGADSATFLTRAQDLARDRGFVIGNIDAVVVAEAPKIAPHASAIRERIAALLDVGVDAVSVRGTSTNGLGFAGRKEGLAAMAVVLLNRNLSNPKSPMILSRLHPVEEAVKARPREIEWVLFDSEPPGPPNQRAEEALPREGSRFATATARPSISWPARPTRESSPG